MGTWIGLLARVVTGGVWLYAGALKLPDPYASVQAVRAYQLLPGELAVAVGHALPVVEVVVGLCLVAGVLTRPAAVVSALLFGAFVVGIASVWARGIEIDCGCFGGGGPKEGASAEYPLEIARDLGLLALSAYLVLRPRTRWSLDATLFPRRTPKDPEPETEDGTTRD